MGLIFGLLWLSVLLVIVAAAGYALWRMRKLRPSHAVALFQVVFGVIAGMLSVDRWGEVFDTIKRNKLRTTLTAISVAWGIMVLVVLLGMGHGLNNGVRHAFRREAQNGIWVSANKTSIPFAGYGIDRHITFDNRDFDRAKKTPGIEHISGQYFMHGGRFGGGEMKTQRGAKSNAFQVNAVHADAIFLGAHEIIEGRYLTVRDVAQKRKVCVIGIPVRDFLFGAPAGEPRDGKDSGGVADPLGQWIIVGDFPFQVVGVFSDEGGEEEERQIDVPVSTAQLAWNGVDHLGMLMFTVGDANAKQAKAISDAVVAQLADAHRFDPADPQAVRVFNNVEGFEKFQAFFFVISVFVVVIGCGTLAAGVVGVSNIMMIAVKERTREIGVRKALGATPLSIVAMIVQEAIFLTSIAGLLGLSAGVGFLQLVPRMIDTDLIRNPSIDVGVGVMAAAGLVIAGAIAGFIPARAAARVNPVQTLRDQ
ncbi:MAG TPA: ABC transporter permease [Kofleriaceae bacterium]|nr:ABC transporter permease [Kofleriaceae bacterium]